MITSAIVVALALAALAFWLRLAKVHLRAPAIVENPANHLRPVDLEAFRNLMDPDEEEYLRRNLPPADFRRVQRQRLRAAVEYIQCAAFNAAVLMRFAETARRSPEPATAQAAVKLIDNAIRLRAHAFQAIPRLYLAMALPGRRMAPAPVAESYEQMTRQVRLLGLQYPIGEIPAAL